MAVAEALASILGRGSELFFDAAYHMSQPSSSNDNNIPEQLVVLGQALRAARGARLDLVHSKIRLHTYKHVLTSPVERPTTRSAMNVSSVSPL